MLPLDITLMNVLESTTRHDETEMAVQPAAKKKKSTAGSVIFQEARRISDIVLQSPLHHQIVREGKSSIRACSHTEMAPD